MKMRDRQTIFKHLLPSLPRFRPFDTFIFEYPIGSILKAINFDPSGWDRNSFYVDVFVMPLYKPIDFVTLTFGERLSTPGLGWALGAPDVIPQLRERIIAKALPFLQDVGSPIGFSNTMLNHSFNNPHFPHAIALSLAKAGEHDRAIALIDDFLPKMNRTRDWEQRIFDQCTFFRDLLARDPDAAHRQLLAWEDYTVGQLGLEKFRAENRSR